MKKLNYLFAFGLLFAFACSGVSSSDEEITITTAGGPKVNGANIVTTDVEASNGVVHIIDAVILPPSE